MFGTVGFLLAAPARDLAEQVIDFAEMSGPCRPRVLTESHAFFDVWLLGTSSPVVDDRTVASSSESLLRLKRHDSASFSEKLDRTLTRTGNDVRAMAPLRLPKRDDDLLVDFLEAAAAMAAAESCAESFACFRRR